MCENYEVELSVNFVLGSKINPNNAYNIFIKAKSADIDEVFDQLIKKHEDLKNINFVLKGVESMTYNFRKIIITNIFIESPVWIKNKSCTINPLNNDNKCCQYSIIISLFHKEIKKNPERISEIKPFINNLD